MLRAAQGSARRAAAIRPRVPTFGAHLLRTASTQHNHGHSHDRQHSHQPSTHVTIVQQRAWGSRLLDMGIGAMLGAAVPFVLELRREILEEEEEEEDDDFDDIVRALIAEHVRLMDNFARAEAAGDRAQMQELRLDLVNYFHYVLIPVASSQYSQTAPIGPYEKLIVVADVALPRIPDHLLGPPSATKAVLSHVDNARLRILATETQGPDGSRVKVIRCWHVYFDTSDVPPASAAEACCRLKHFHIEPLLRAEGPSARNGERLVIMQGMNRFAAKLETDGVFSG